MSEEFDKEAEREKLREKYGEADDREATRQMSELLLKGATMTNRHCDTCGDPVFRYDGQEFCPTCQGTGETAQDTPPETGVEEQPTGDESRRQRESPERQPTASAPAPAEGDRDLAAARASLERTLTRFARAAEATEDPRAARERLVAAREAAEALSTLRR